MRQFLMTLVLMSSVSALACETQEAQFIGRVKNASTAYLTDAAPICSYEIEYSVFNPSSVCPLDIDAVAGFQFSDSSCTLRNGDAVSGVLVQKGEDVVIQ